MYVRNKQAIFHFGSDPSVRSCGRRVGFASRSAAFSKRSRFLVCRMVLMGVLFLAGLLEKAYAYREKPDKKRVVKKATMQIIQWV